MFIVGIALRVEGLAWAAIAASSIFALKTTEFASGERYVLHFFQLFFGVWLLGNETNMALTTTTKSTDTTSGSLPSGYPTRDSSVFPFGHNEWVTAFSGKVLFCATLVPIMTVLNACSLVAWWHGRAPVGGLKNA